MSGQHEYDVLVAGSGIAGLSAAAAALQNGARVAILERAPPEDRGGNTRWTDALMRMKRDREVSDDFEEHFAKNSGYYLDPSLMREVASGSHEQWSGITRTLSFTDPEVIATFADRAGPTIEWLQSFGIRFDFLPTYFLTACQPRLAPVGGGLALVEALGAWVDANGADTFYRTTARRLVQRADGRVAGLYVTDAEGRGREIRAHATILACGGFEGNPEMLARYIGPGARYIRPVARGGYYNKGEGLRMALEVGSAPCGDFSSFHAEPLDPRSGAPEPIVLVFNYGVLVNKQGRRFVDEAPATVDATYESITRIIHQQNDGIGYVILDAKIDDVPNWRKAVRSDVPPHTAPTLEALADEIGVDPITLIETISAYNDACPAPDGFQALNLDGLRTKDGYQPRKSNWARRIDTSPFRAFPVICGNCFTFGGVKINTKAQVLDTDGIVIPGLYAGGEMIGLYYGTYTGATSVLRGAVFGKIAGADAAQSAVARNTARSAAERPLLEPI
ncbi:MAG: FAD-dependent oxidoreductase [Acetobacteraceae bacterium]|nr:FAD-dependent oxidoreductase [Acetobacteraceae bacterium]